MGAAAPIVVRASRERTLDEYNATSRFPASQTHLPAFPADVHVDWKRDREFEQMSRPAAAAEIPQLAKPA